MTSILKTQDENKELLQQVIAGIQEKKGTGIRVLDLRNIDDTITDYIVVCQGNTPIQVAAISNSVEDTVRKNIGMKPVHTAGMRNAIWVALDYTDVIVHVFEPEARNFYDVDNLWDDAVITEIADED
jgi:ribosome-associated protein